MKTLLRPSSAKRWLNCPGSVRVCSDIDDGAAGAAAAEGTSAHELAELCLRSGDWDATQYVGAIGETPGAEPWSDAMAKAVNVYLETIRQHFDPLADEIHVETALDAVTSGDFYTAGTGDCIVWKPEERHLHVFDYKHGAGVVVEVEDNPQVRIYAVGAAKRFHNYGVEKVSVWIVQPRAPHADGPVRRADMDALDLVDFGLDVADGMARIAAPDAPLVPGEWCKFCPAERKGKCPARAAQFAAVFEEIAEPTDVPADELADRIARAEAVVSYAKAMIEHAEKLARSGQMPRGMKWVAGRGRRVWAVAEDDVAARLAKTHEADFWERVFPSVAQIEARIGKQWFAPSKKHGDANGLLADLVTMKPGKPKLVKETDRRPAIDISSLSTEAFEDIE